VYLVAHFVWEAPWCDFISWREFTLCHRHRSLVGDKYKDIEITAIKRRISVTPKSLSLAESLLVEMINLYTIPDLDCRSHVLPKFQTTSTCQIFPCVGNLTLWSRDIEYQLEYLSPPSNIYCRLPKRCTFQFPEDNIH